MLRYSVVFLGLLDLVVISQAIASAEIRTLRDELKVSPDVSYFVEAEFIISTRLVAQGSGQQMDCDWTIYAEITLPDEFIKKEVYLVLGQRTRESDNTDRLIATHWRPLAKTVRGKNYGGPVVFMFSGEAAVRNRDGTLARHLPGHPRTTSEYRQAARAHIIASRLGNLELIMGVDNRWFYAGRLQTELDESTGTHVASTTLQSSDLRHIKLEVDLDSPRARVPLDQLQFIQNHTRDMNADGIPKARVAFEDRRRCERLIDTLLSRSATGTFDLHDRWTGGAQAAQTMGAVPLTSIRGIGGPDPRNVRGFARDHAGYAIRVSHRIAGTLDRVPPLLERGPVVIDAQTFDKDREVIARSAGVFRAGETLRFGNENKTLTDTLARIGVDKPVKLDAFESRGRRVVDAAFRRTEIHLWSPRTGLVQLRWQGWLDRKSGAAAWTVESVSNPESPEVRSFLRRHIAAYEAELLEALKEENGESAAPGVLPMVGDSLP